jgi:hypothetical protein
MRSMRTPIVSAFVACSLASLAVAVGARGDDEHPALVDPSDAEVDAVANDASDAATTDAPEAISNDSDASDAAVPPNPTAQPSNVGFAFGLRVGVAFPVGRVNNRPISDVLTNAIPVTIDVGYFLDPHLYLGLFGTFAFVTSSSTDTTTCPTSADCTARRWRFGALAAWHFRPRAVLNPFVGVAVAYDLVNLTASDSKTGDVVESSALQGIEFVEVQTGLEIRPQTFWGFGPYVNASAGAYSSAWNVHGWFGGGLRFFSVL